MDIANRIYPYPILSNVNGSVLDSHFDVEVEPTILQDGLKVSFAFSVALKNKALKQLVENRNVGIFVHVECPLTTFREVYQILPEVCQSRSEERLEGKWVKEIPATKLSKRVEVCPFIIACKDFRYSNEKVDSFYQGMTFDIDAGAILAEGTQKVFNVDIARTKLKSTNSIFYTVPSTNENQVAMSVDSDEDRIRITMPKAMFDCYHMMKSSTANDSMLWSLIIIPAFVSALERVRTTRESDREAFENLSQLKWFISVNKVVREKYGFELDSEAFVASDVVEMASSIIGNPLGTVLNELVREEEDGR